MTGRIIKGVAGSYLVHNGERAYVCSAKGIFRKNHEKPLVGDQVDFDVISEAEGEGNIVRIHPRKNSLIRPEAANVDRIFLTFAATDPDPNFEMLNRYLIWLYDLEIPVSLIVNKCDLVTEKEKNKILSAFQNTGYPIYFASVKEQIGIEEIREALQGQVSAFAGPSGVGKSSLVNELLGTEKMETGELSERIRRGKNTTRHTEIMFLSENTFLFDTPGFTSVEPENVLPENLALCFPEFHPYFGKCRFLSCNHLKEPDCAVKAAVAAKEISPIRYLSYAHMYEYLKNQRRY